MPRVSVILPNYNYARYLRERVCSILNQTERDFELLYLDDASKDESNRVMESFAGDSRVTLTLFKENSGQVYRRWNDGANLAKGDWLWFAGADDSADPRFLAELLALADRHPTAAIVHSGRLTIDAGGRLLAARWHGLSSIESHLMRPYFAPGHEEAVRLTSASYLSTASAILLRRDAFHAAGGFDARLWLDADWNLYMTMLRDHDIAYTPAPLAQYRLHPQTVTKTTAHVTSSLEDAYCVARAYAWLRDDPRTPDEAKQLVMRRLKSRLFDVFLNEPVTIPDKLRFAADAIYEIVPDRRLQDGV